MFHYWSVVSASASLCVWQHKPQTCRSGMIKRARNSTAQPFRLNHFSNRDCELVMCINISRLLISVIFSIMIETRMWRITPSCQAEHAAKCVINVCISFKHSINVSVFKAGSNSEYHLKTYTIRSKVCGCLTPTPRYGTYIKYIFCQAPQMQFPKYCSMMIILRAAPWTRDVLTLE